jgi:hypothetical protein
MSSEQDKKKEELKIDLGPSNRVLAEKSEELGRLKEKLEQAEAKGELSQVDDLSERKLKMFQELGDERLLQVTSKQELIELSKSIIKDAIQKSRGEPSGEVAITDAQLGKTQSSDILTKKFSSIQEMIKELRQREKSSNPETANQAKNIMTALYRKWDQARREGRIQNYGPNTQEALKELGLTEKGGFLTPVDETRGDLGTYKKKLQQKIKEKEEI